MREGNEGYPVWSELTEGLLWHKSQKILMVVMGGMCHNPQCITPCCIWGCVAADRSVPMMTPVHRRKRLQWARERRNWTLEQWKKVAWSDESHFL